MVDVALLRKQQATTRTDIVAVSEMLVPRILAEHSFGQAAFDTSPSIQDASKNSQVFRKDQAAQTIYILGDQCRLTWGLQICGRCFLVGLGIKSGIREGNRWMKMTARKA